MHSSWKERLTDEIQKSYFRELADFLSEERRARVVFPPANQVFTAFKVTPYDRANVVILGQDPYHNAGQAHGLCFSVQPGVKPPPSLRNIYKELETDLGVKPPRHGNLMGWAEQGVFLLNAVLTVRAHEAGSHQGKGWERFTDAVLSLLSAREEPAVFILWGRYARDKKGLIDTGRHTVIESAHPSPMSARGFFGTKPFSRANEALVAAGHSEIDWQLP